jgi:hypothetical protein
MPKNKKISKVMQRILKQAMPYIDREWKKPYVNNA